MSATFGEDCKLQHSQICDGEADFFTHMINPKLRHIAGKDNQVVDMILKGRLICLGIT